MSLVHGKEPPVDGTAQRAAAEPGHQARLARKPWVDYAKAIGIILVVYGHTARGLYSAGLPLNKETFKLIDDAIYSFHMPLFFFLSGFFFNKSLKSRGPSLLVANKFDTIIYPYLVWSLLQGLTEVAMSHWTNGNAHIADIFSLLWAPRAQFWFLYALFIISLIGIATYSIFTEKQAGSICLAGVALYLARPYLPDNKIVQAAAGYFIFFSFGAYFFSYAQFFHQNRFRLLLLFSALFVGGQYLLCTEGGLKALPLPHALFIAIASILFVVTACMCLTKWHMKTLGTIGATSMAIYLAHIIVASGIRIIAYRIFGIQDIALHLLAGCIAGIVVPIFLARNADRLKIGFLFDAPLSLSLERVFRRFTQASAKA